MQPQTVWKAPVLGQRVLLPYVPLRFHPSESVSARTRLPCAGISQDAKNRPKMAFCLHPQKNYVKYYFPH